MKNVTTTTRMTKMDATLIAAYNSTMVAKMSLANALLIQIIH
jgi:hypothetical protein